MLREKDIGYCAPILQRYSSMSSERKQYVGAVDQGTTSTRFILFSSEGELVATHQIEHKQYFPQSGWVEHDPIGTFLYLDALDWKALNQPPNTWDFGCFTAEYLPLLCFSYYASAWRFGHGLIAGNDHFIAQKFWKRRRYASTGVWRQLL